MMVIENKYSIGDIVYHKTCKDQFERIITSILITGNGGLQYECRFGGETKWFYEIELATEKNVLITTSN